MSDVILARVQVRDLPTPVQVGIAPQSFQVVVR